MKWQLESRGLFYDANEGSVIYYDPASGDTHLLSEFAACLLQQFTDKPLGTTELCHALQAQVADQEPAELEGAIAGVLEELVSLRIVQTA